MTRSDSIICKSVKGGIGISPYTFIDGYNGYIIIPNCTNRSYHTMDWGLYNVDTKDYLDGKKDKMSGIDHCKHLTKYDKVVGTTSFIPGCIPWIYCKNYTCDDYNDYFLPNLNELLFISRHKEIINDCDPGSSSTRLSVIDYVWSSTSHSRQESYIVHIPSNSVSIEYRYYKLQVLPIKRSKVL